MEKPKIRQWVVDSDSPFIERTPEEAQLYFKRRRAANAERMAARTPETIAILQRDLLLLRKGRLHS